MKFNKSILFTTLIASAVALTACNEEKKVAPANNAQATQEEKVDAQNAKTQFEQAVKITATKRALTKDAKGNATVSVTYDIENTGDKAIKAIHWISAYSFEGKILYLENIPAEFRSTVENPNSNIQTVIGPMSIEFADGSKIIANK